MKYTSSIVIMVKRLEGGPYKQIKERLEGGTLQKENSRQ